jgi:hypothetical protein
MIVASALTAAGAADMARSIFACAESPAMTGSEAASAAVNSKKRLMYRWLLIVTLLFA